MQKIKSREEFMTESVNSLNEDEIVKIDIKLETDPDTVFRSINSMSGVEDPKILPFGVIKAKAMKKKIAEIKNLAGVEDVEIVDAEK